MNMYGMNEPQAEAVSDFLIETVVDLMKVTFDFIHQDLTDGTADNWCYINVLGQRIERLLNIAGLMRQECDPSLAEEIRGLKQKTVKHMDILRERAMRIDCVLRGDETMDDAFEEILNRPSAEQDAAEREEAFRTGGASLLKKKDGEASRP